MLELAGYSQRDYAYSLQEFGKPRELPRSGGWIIERSIPGTPYRDATGCYPLFACRDWSRLSEDLDEIGEDLVSLALVADPLSAPIGTELAKCFGHVAPFKKHYLADLSVPLNKLVSKRYRRYASRSLENMDVEICTEPGRYLDEWMRLYDMLIKRHCIHGIRAFSRRSFAMQLNMHGMVMFLGRRDGEAVGALLTLSSGPYVHFHLAASNGEGYAIRSAYGLYWTAFKYYQEMGVRNCDIGGVAGLKDDPEDNLAIFKRGWSNDQCMAYFCGRVFNQQAYESICRQYHAVDVGYFPAYRAVDMSDAA